MKTKLGSKTRKIPCKLFKTNCSYQQQDSEEAIKDVVLV